MEKIIASPYFRKAAWIGAALLLAYTLAGFVIAPSWLARAVPDYAERYLGRRASVGDIRINPYLFSLEVSGLQLDDAPGRFSSMMLPASHCSSLAVCMSISSCRAFSGGPGHSRMWRWKVWNYPW